jgi:hypothetical protein
MGETSDAHKTEFDENIKKNKHGQRNSRKLSAFPCSSV